MERFIYGTPSLTLSEVLDNFFALQENDRRRHYMSYMVAAKWAWKEIFRRTVWTVMQRYVEVNPDDNTFVFPNGVLRLINISIVDDCNNLKPLSYNANINTLKLQAAPVKCSCSACKGSGTICDAMDYISVRTEDVVLEDGTYIKRIWNKKCENGDLAEVTETPYWDAEAAEVKIDVQQKALCKLDLDDKGCIKSTDHNQQLIINHCGCFIISCHKKMCDTIVPLEKNHAGYYKEDAEQPNKFHLVGVKAKHVIVSWQSNGDNLNGGEVMVPEYAVQALFFGIAHFHTAFNTMASQLDKRSAKADFVGEHKKLKMFMNPVNVTEFMNLSNLTMKW